ncbi:MAG: AAA family ATPase, partial [Desulfobacteraceae bacterium]|nr:AAA family ATPase [Desulfobacteraceae bacterium]
MFSKNKRKQLKKAKQRLLRHFPSDSSYAESFRTLRTNLFFSVMEKDLKSVVITSSVEGEGKTTTASNLAYAIAQADRKVLLIDLDLRRRQLSRLFNLNREPGVTNLINDVLGIHLIKGNLDTYSVNDLIQLAKLQRMSCILDLDDQKSQVKITFERGRMTDIYWKNRPLSKKLANILINNKQLTEKEAFQALGHQKKSVQRLGTILYTMGLVSKQNISKALTVHTIEAIKT